MNFKVNGNVAFGKTVLKSKKGTHCDTSLKFDYSKLHLAINDTFKKLQYSDADFPKDNHYKINITPTSLKLNIKSTDGHIDYKEIATIEEYTPLENEDQIKKLCKKINNEIKNTLPKIDINA